MLTVSEIAALLKAADRDQLNVLERSLAADQRKGVVAALATARRRIETQEAEAERLAGLYEYQNELADQVGGSVIVGLDEVGRGPLAGPLAVGAVVLPDAPRMCGLNDSKQLTVAKRNVLAQEIKAAACAYAVVFIEPATIDSQGITASLKQAFSQAVATIEAQGIVPDVVLLDGNPLKFDVREVNVVKGDARCASIAAASIVAKVARDALMDELDLQYPGYGFAHNKGYGSSDHIAAIEELGLTAVHRKSFCKRFTQQTLF